MSAIRLTKNELKRQKDLLKRFQRYLPTLILKMQQLKVVLNRIEKRIEHKESERQSYLEANRYWMSLFGEKVDLVPLIEIEKLSTSSENIAGVLVPNFICIDFRDRRWDLMATPLWVDAGVRHVKRLTSLDAELAVLNRQRDLIAQELLITTQRVNLFEKLKIPETRENIRVISVYLGDQQTVAVVRGKIAKRNLLAGNR